MVSTLCTQTFAIAQCNSTIFLPKTIAI